MSKIAKALEKAKAAQAGQGPAAREPQPAASRAEVVQEESPAPGYTCTRVLPVDQGHLESCRIRVAGEDIKTTDIFNLLRTQILQRTKDQGWNTLMVTSARSREGKTTMSINLAMSIARDMQQTAMLVETDLRKPDVSDYLGLNVDRGLSDYLIDDVPLSELLINPGIDKLVVLPAGRALKGSTDLLGSPRMKQLVHELKQRYPDRYVIFDSLPLLDMPDALVFASYVDAILMVVEAGKTTRRDISKALEMISPGNLLGLVMNKAV